MTTRRAIGATLIFLVAGCSSTEPASSPSQVTSATPTPASAVSIEGTYECGGTLPPEGGQLTLVWIWELMGDGTLTVTGPDDVVHEGTWSGEAGAGVASVEGGEGNTFTIEGDRLVFEAFECTRAS